MDETSVHFPQPNLTEYTNQLTIGDIDGDGDLDIIFANGTGFASPGAAQTQRVYINDGDGVFTDESAARLNFTGWCRGVELGDIDNDGDLDLIFAQDFNKLPHLFTNNGSGFFTDVTAAQLPNITLSSSRAQFGDVDNDGDLDIYITSGSGNRFGCGQYRLYLNDGEGFFTDETVGHLPIGNVCSNMDCIFGDIDGDFDLDVKTASTGGNNSRLYRNDGTGVFSLVTDIPPDSTCYSYDFGDINGDGDLDLLGVNAGSGSTELLLENDGMGAFTNISGQISPNPSVDDNDSKFFDYDNDGDLDLIIAKLGSGGERIYNNDGNGNFTQVFGLITVISDSSLDIMVADLTGNGKLDIVTAQGESGSFVNRIYINYGPADTIAPNIVRTEQLKDTDDTVGPYVVRTVIYDQVTSDRGFFDHGVTLNYSVGAGPGKQVPMTWSGNSLWRGEIPGQPEGGTITYFVTAFDSADNLGAGNDLSFTVGAIAGDLNGDGTVGATDLLILLSSWGRCDDCNDCSADIDGNCAVGASDLLILLANWG
ncbi:MAG: FG-GAP-like repeat-containing protein [Phycisphaerales bacterium]